MSATRIYQLGIRPMKAEDIIEADNFSELVALMHRMRITQKGKKMNSKKPTEEKRNRLDDYAGALALIVAYVSYFLCILEQSNQVLGQIRFLFETPLNVLPSQWTWHFLSVSVWQAPNTEILCLESRMRS